MLGLENVAKGQVNNSGNQIFYKIANRRKRDHKEKMSGTKTSGLRLMRNQLFKNQKSPDWNDMDTLLEGSE